jgi:hypothetical protein
MSEVLPFVVYCPPSRIEGQKNRVNGHRITRKVHLHVVHNWRRSRACVDVVMNVRSRVLASSHHELTVPVSGV